MPKKVVPGEVLNIVKKKTGKSVSPSDIQKLAKGVKPATMQSDEQLRQLIKQVSAMAGVPVAESTVKEIIKAVKSSGGNMSSMEQMMKMLMKK